MKTHNTILTITILYFVLIAYLSGFGPLSFGAGLGGLMYLLYRKNGKPAMYFPSLLVWLISKI